MKKNTMDSIIENALPPMYKPLFAGNTIRTGLSQEENIRLITESAHKQGFCFRVKHKKNGDVDVTIFQHKSRQTGKERSYASSEL